MSLKVTSSFTALVTDQHHLQTLLPQFFFDEYSPTGTLIKSIAIPTNVDVVNRRIIASGTEDVIDVAHDRTVATGGSIQGIENEEDLKGIESFDIV